MKRTYVLMAFVALLATVIFSSCKKDNAQGAEGPVITLSSEKFTGKSGQELLVTVTVKSTKGVSGLAISKGVNLTADDSFGTNGLINIQGGGNELVYVFNYTLLPEEVDKLVGFNFKAEDVNGASSEKDFTLNTTVSGEQLLYSYKWNLRSKMWQTDPAKEDITDCEKDDGYIFNQDGTMSYVFGSSACGLDGLNVYTNWTLSPDEKELSITYHSLFNPQQITVDKYRVLSLTREKLIIDITFDLTIFGLSDKELFVYTYEASRL